MAMQHTGNKEVDILKIIIDGKFELRIFGKITDYKHNKLNYNKDLTSKIEVRSNFAYKKFTRGSEDSLIENLEDEMEVSFFEDGRYNITLEKEDNHDYEIVHNGYSLEDNSVNLSRNIKFTTVDFSSDIGYSDFIIKENGKEILDFTIEVFPTKLDYKNDYKEILKSVNENIRSLAFDMLGKTYISTKIEDTNNQTNNEFINILIMIFKELEIDINRIVRNFKHNIITIEKKVKAEKAKRISRKTINYIRKHRNTLTQDKNGIIEIGNERYSPTEVINKKKVTTIDIFENRYVKYMIQSIVRRMKNVNEILDKLKGDSESLNLYKEFLVEKRIKLQNILDIHFKDISDLGENKGMSLVFQMSPGYRELYRKYIILRKGLDISNDMFKITPKKMHKLYEIWCFMEMHKIIKSLGYNVSETDMFNYSNNGIYTNLLTDKSSKIIYKKDNEELELWYNKSYDKLPTGEQKPDVVLVKKEEDYEDRVYIFDSKYRVDVDKNGKVGPMKDDINVMHKYRDSIVSNCGQTSNKYKYDSLGGYVMFPCQTEFRNHSFYKSISNVNIGAIPMLPQNTELMKEHLTEILGESLLKAKGRRVTLSDLDKEINSKENNTIIFGVENYEEFKDFKTNKYFKTSKIENSREISYIAIHKSKKDYELENVMSDFYGKITEEKLIREDEKELIEFKLKELKDINLEVADELFDGELINRYLLENARGFKELLDSDSYISNNGNYIANKGIIKDPIPTI
ncbi:MAG: DUF2357 domain-containing protein [Clostridium chrysemydis]|uniref:DUF2357 domain-containing protein n=1 Tax=Clostridium chrysemydis TaxID=2665504 RepID=UPI003F2B1779